MILIPPPPLPLHQAPVPVPVRPLQDPLAKVLEIVEIVEEVAFSRKSKSELVVVDQENEYLTLPEI